MNYVQKRFFRVLSLSFAIVGICTFGRWAGLEQTPASAISLFPDPVGIFPEVTGEVYAMALSENGSVLYIGGDFSYIYDFEGEYERTNLAAIDTETYEVLPWAPVANGEVRAIAVSGSYVYVGGGFSTINGTARSEFAKLEGTTGAVDAGCDPNFYYGETVYVIKIAGEDVYVGGNFVKVGGSSGTPRNGLARLDESDCSLDAWDPAPAMYDFVLEEPYGYGGGFVSVFAIDLYGSDVYVGGEFAYIGGKVQTEFARLDNVTGMADPGCGMSFNYDYYAGEGDATVYSIHTTGDYIYVGGSFGHVYDTVEMEYFYDRDYIARLNNDASCSMDSWNPDPSYTVRTINTLEGDVYVGGSFSAIGDQDGSEFAKLDSVSGQVDGLWNPGVESCEFRTVYSSLVTDSRVFIGGSFCEVAEEYRYGLAMFEIDRAAPSILLDPLSPDPTSDTTPSFLGTAIDDLGWVSSVEYQVDTTAGSWNTCVREGSFDESFESETFPPAGWTLSGTAWTLDDTDAYDGEQSAISGDISCEGYWSSRMDTSITVTGPSYLSFYWKVDTSSALYEPGLMFCLDNEDCSYYSEDWDFFIDGITDWQRVLIPLDAGTHTLTWAYEFSEIYCMSGLFQSAGVSGWVDNVEIIPMVGSFTCNVFPALADGTHTIYVRATDSNGNTTTAGSFATDVFTIDTTPPPASVGGVDGTGVGAGEDDLSTSDPRPTFSGTTEPGSTVRISFPGLGIEGEVTAGHDGSWSWRPGQDLPPGDHRMVLGVTDQAGNQRTVEYQLEVLGLTDTGSAVMYPVMVGGIVLGVSSIRVVRKRKIT